MNLQKIRSPSFRPASFPRILKVSHKKRFKLLKVVASPTLLQKRALMISNMMSILITAWRSMISIKTKTMKGSPLERAPDKITRSRKHGCIKISLLLQARVHYKMISWTKAASHIKDIMAKCAKENPNLLENLTNLLTLKSISRLNSSWGWILELKRPEVKRFISRTY